MKWRNIITGILCLLAGCAIYLLLRSHSIRLYRWVEATLGTSWLEPLRAGAASWDVPEFVRFSLPDGLWCAAYVIIADAVWAQERGLRKHFVVLVLPAVAIVHECLQAMGLARGRFDVADLLCYAVPVVVYAVAAFRK